MLSSRSGLIRVKSAMARIGQHRRGHNWLDQRMQRSKSTVGREGEHGDSVVSAMMKARSTRSARCHARREVADESDRGCKGEGGGSGLGFGSS